MFQNNYYSKDMKYEVFLQMRNPLISLFNEQYNILDFISSDYNYQSTAVYYAFESRELAQESETSIIQDVYFNQYCHEKQYNGVVLSIFLEQPTEITFWNIKKLYAEFTGRYFSNIIDDMYMHDMSRRHFMIKYLISKNMLPCSHTLNIEIKNVQLQVFKLQNMEKIKSYKDLGIIKEFQIQVEKLLKQYPFICIQDTNITLKGVQQISGILYQYIQEVIQFIFSFDHPIGHLGIYGLIEILSVNDQFNRLLKTCSDIKQLLILVYFLYLFAQQEIIVNIQQEQLDKFQAIVTAVDDLGKIEKIISIVSDMGNESTLQQYNQSGIDNEVAEHKDEDLENINQEDNDIQETDGQVDCAIQLTINPLSQLIQFVGTIKSLQLDRKLYMFDQTIGDEEKQYLKRVLYVTRFLPFTNFIQQVAEQLLLADTKSSHGQSQSGQYQSGSNRSRGGTKKSSHSGKKRGRR